MTVYPSLLSEGAGLSALTRKLGLPRQDRNPGGVSQLLVCATADSIIVVKIDYCPQHLGYSLERWSHSNSDKPVFRLKEKQSIELRSDL